MRYYQFQLTIRKTFFLRDPYDMVINRHLNKTIVTMISTADGTKIFLKNPFLALV